MTFISPVKPHVGRDAFLGAVRQIASSVTVVITDGTSGHHGATVSAYNSHSADPPSVLICLRADSSIAKAVAENGRYCINLLPEDQPDHAGRFAEEQDAECSDRFYGDALSQSDTTCPKVLNTTSFHGDVNNVVSHGSHLILIGQVTAITECTNPPLTYMDGRFHRILPH